jgi:hypothetical protein
MLCSGSPVSCDQIPGAVRSLSLASSCQGPGVPGRRLPASCDRSRCSPRRYQPGRTPARGAGLVRTLAASVLIASIAHKVELALGL